MNERIQGIGAGIKNGGLDGREIREMEGERMRMSERVERCSEIGIEILKKASVPIKRDRLHQMVVEETIKKDPGGRACSAQGLIDGMFTLTVHDHNHKQYEGTVQNVGRGLYRFVETVNQSGLFDEKKGLPQFRGEDPPIEGLMLEIRELTLELKIFRQALVHATKTLRGEEIESISTPK